MNESLLAEINGTIYGRLNDKKRVSTKVYYKFGFLAGIEFITY